VRSPALARDPATAVSRGAVFVTGTLIVAMMANVARTDCLWDRGT
jgi:hypothetical protein